MRKVELILVRAEIGEEVEAFVERAVGLGIGLVDLVQNDDGAQAKRERLRGHELRLGHRPLGGIHEQNDTVYHRQDALHLAAEIGVARRVDDVDPRRLPLDRGRLGENGDPRSRSRSLESIARSATCWFSRNAPDCFSNSSTSVVLPWST